MLVQFQIEVNWLMIEYTVINYVHRRDLILGRDTLQKKNRRREAKR